MNFLSNENALQSYKRALKSRKYKQESYIFNINFEENIISIINGIKTKNYKHDSYRLLIINDNKKRYISSPTLRDHILHHMVYSVCYGVLDKRLPHNSFATRLGKGQYRAIEYFLKQLKTIAGKGDLYFMKIDISKYFYSIPHECLLSKIFRYINDDDLRYAIKTIIGSYKTDKRYNNLFAPNSNYLKFSNKGLPIGAIHSQLFANFFFYDLDHYINQILKPKIYLRYMDDLIFVDTQQKLKEIKETIIFYIENELRLNVNPKKVSINSLKFGIGLLGYKIKIKSDNIIIEVNKRNKKKFWKSIDTIGQLDLMNFSKNDLNRILSVINSRKSMFLHTRDYSKYIGKLPLQAKGASPPLTGGSEQG